MTDLRPAPIWRLAWVASAALLLFTVGLFMYGGHNWTILKSGVWLPGWDWRYQVDQTALAWREHLIPLAGLLLLAAVPQFRRAVLGQISDDPGEFPPGKAWPTWLLMAALALIYALFGWDQWNLTQAWLAQTGGDKLGEEPSSFGLLLVAAAGLLGGWRWGLAFGALNLAVGGGLFVAADIFKSYAAEPWLRSLLSQTWAVGGLWAGVVCGAIGDWLRRELRGTVSIPPRQSLA